VSAAAPVPAAGGLVVLELFTSEGCNSCPPAEEELKQLVRENPNGSVLALAYHVDYWDHLGWADPFADPRNSDRQRAYDAILSPARVYTPQMIVNGAYETVGSSEQQLPRLIAKARAAPVAVEIAVIGVRPVDGGWEVDYAASGRLEQATVFAALVESGLESKITAGENKGMLLTHDHVVRGFAEADLADSGTLRLASPGVDLERSEIVVLAHDRASRRVLGGARAGLSGSLEAAPAPRE
jgi:hypothetical protein